MRLTSGNVLLDFLDRVVLSHLAKGLLFALFHSSLTLLLILYKYAEAIAGAAPEQQFAKHDHACLYKHRIASHNDAPVSPNEVYVNFHE